MAILKPIKDLFYINRAYVNTDVNLLSKQSWNLRNEEYLLTTDGNDGIHMDKDVRTQDIYVSNEPSDGPLYHLNNKYVELNTDLMSLNLCRCCIYLPVEIKPKDWYQDELDLEYLRGKYSG